MSAKLEKVKNHPGIYRRGSRYVVTWRDRSGKQRRQSAGTLAEARDLKAKNHNQRGPTRRITFAAYAPLWLEGYRGRNGDGNIGAGTLADYQRSLEQDAIPYFSRQRLDEITTGEVKRYRSHLERRGLAPTSVAKALTVARLVFAGALEDDDYGLPSNPALGVRAGRPQGDEEREEKVKALKPDELARLLDELPDEWRLFFEFLFETGLRISEAIEVRWGNVAPDKIHVLRQFYRGGLGKPKGNKEREVPLSARMALELRKRRAAQADGDLVFTAERGGRLIPSNLMRRILKPAAVRAGLGEWKIERGRKRAETWVGFHTFRHSSATQLFLRGWNAKQVSVFLGHSDPAFTLRTYVDLLPENLPTPWGDNEVTTGATETGRNETPKRTLELAG